MLVQKIEIFFWIFRKMYAKILFKSMTLKRGPTYSDFELWFWNCDLGFVTKMLTLFRRFFWDSEK